MIVSCVIEAKTPCIHTSTKVVCFEAQIFEMPWIYAKRRQILDIFRIIRILKLFSSMALRLFFQMRRSLLRIYLEKKVHS